MPLVAMSLTLEPSVESPAPVGTKVTWTASAGDTGTAPVWYRFRSRALGEPYRTIRDFGPEPALDWTASKTEGLYEVEVSARNLETGETDTQSKIFEMTSRVTDGNPVVSPTQNQLVFLYSAPPCEYPGRMRVQFQSADGQLTTTPFKACLPNTSMNFYLAGMKASSSYVARHFLDTGTDFVRGPDVPFSTPDFAPELAPYTVLMPPSPATSTGILLQSTLSEMTIATDLAGNLVWYYPAGITSLTRPVGNGKYLGIYEVPLTDPSLEIVREFDLAGFTLRETNAARVSQQLVAMGKHPISSFHHEARRMSDGNIVVLASTERFLTDVQGPGEVNVLGDDIIVLNDDLEVIWVWDSFDHLDTRRMATLNETCAPIGGGCPPFHKSEIANDWLHGNSVQETEDGDFLYSARHQDWLIKIDYRFGEGSGDVLWRLGKDGDFRFISDDPYPWFSHQHDAGFTADGKLLTVFDNGNTRFSMDESIHSRGQAWQLDEVNRTATQVLNADLGVYSFALGSAYLLPDGGYHFNLGWVLGSGWARAVELDTGGTLVYSVEAQTPLYRSFRLLDLYTAPSY